MSKLIKLAQLIEEVKSCNSCQLGQFRTNTVFSRGNPDSPIVFLGEAPGADEDLQGKPFVGRSGKLLDNMIRAMQLDPDDVYICNINKCRPPNNRKPLPEEMTACKPFLTQQLDLVKPKVIVTLGATATEGILGPGIGITKRRGQWGRYNGIAVMPTYHPAYCLRNPPSKHEVWLDLQAVMNYLKEQDVKTGEDFGR